MSAARRAAASVLIAVLLMSLCGCWDYNDPEDLLYITGMAFDREGNGRILCTMEYSVVKGGSMAGSPAYLEIEGDTFYDTIRSTIKIADKQLNWSHTAIVIVSQAVAKNDIGDLVDMILRSYEFRDTVYLLVSKQATASEVLTAPNPEQDLNSMDIIGSLRAEKQLEEAPDVKLYEFADMLTDEMQSAVLPAVGLGESKGQKIVEISGTAVFRGPWLQGFLNEIDTRSMMMLDFKKDLYDLPLTVDPGGKFTSADVMFLLDRLDLFPEYENGRVKLNIFIRGQAELVEIAGASSDPGKFETVTNAVTTATATEVENSIRAFLVHTQQMGACDVINIGNKMKTMHPDVWKQINGQWREYYGNMEINVKAGVTLRNTGINIQPLTGGK